MILKHSLPSTTATLVYNINKVFFFILLPLVPIFLISYALCGYSMKCAFLKGLTFVGITIVSLLTSTIIHRKTNES